VTQYPGRASASPSLWRGVVCPGSCLGSETFIIPLKNTRTEGMKKEFKIDKRYITKEELKARGWTDLMIKLLLGNPDDTVKDPYYGNVSIKLYLVKRVSRIENSAVFFRLREMSVERHEAMRKVARMEEKEILKYIDSIEIKVEKMDMKKIKKLAIEEYNSRQIESGHVENMILYEKYLDNAFLSRIMVNYIRHNLTSYEDLLEELKGKEGKYEAYIKLKNKILEKIAEVYPELREECNRQMVIKGDNNGKKDNLEKT